MFSIVSNAAIAFVTHKLSGPKSSNVGEASDLESLGSIFRSFPYGFHPQKVAPMEYSKSFSRQNSVPAEFPAPTSPRLTREGFEIVAPLTDYLGAADPLASAAVSLLNLSTPTGSQLNHPKWLRFIPALTHPAR
jgi:hypothetical protein